MEITKEMQEVFLKETGTVFFESDGESLMFFIRPLPQNPKICVVENASIERIDPMSYNCLPMQRVAVANQESGQLLPIDKNLIHEKATELYAEFCKIILQELFDEQGAINEDVLCDPIYQEMFPQNMITKYQESTIYDLDTLWVKTQSAPWKKAVIYMASQLFDATETSLYQLVSHVVSIQTSSSRLFREFVLRENRDLFFELIASELQPLGTKMRLFRQFLAKGKDHGQFSLDILDSVNAFFVTQKTLEKTSETTQNQIQKMKQYALMNAVQESTVGKPIFKNALIMDENNIKTHYHIIPESISPIGFMAKALICSEERPFLLSLTNTVKIGNKILYRKENTKC